MFSKKKNKEKKSKFIDFSIDLTTSNISEDAILAEKKKLPFLGDLSISNQYKILGTAAFIFLSGMVFSGFNYGSSVTNESNIIKSAASLSTEVNKVEVLFNNSLDRDIKSYNELINLSNLIIAQFQYLQKMTNNNSSLISYYQDIALNLNKINANITLLNQQQHLMLNEEELVSILNEKINKEQALIRDFENLYYSLLNNNINVVMASNNIGLLKESLNNVNLLLTNILLSKEISREKINELRKQQEFIINMFVLIKNGDKSKNIPSISNINNVNLNAIFGKIEEQWFDISGNITGVYNIYTSEVTEQLLREQTKSYIVSVVNSVNELSELYKQKDLSKIHLAQYQFFIFLILLLATMFTVLIAYFYNSYNRSLMEKLEYNQNKNSTLNLIAEMMPLQDGDLTKKATVNDELTGSIADFINSTIDSLASLVRKIKETSFVMDNKTKELSDVARKTLSIADEQNVSLNNTETVISKITSAINNISIQTDESAKEAEKSVELSKQGYTQVNNSVIAMNEINLNMAETVVLMNKVGSSSKQISEVAELLSDITEQTSILAINATIQASKAGDKGNGFKVIADSIQTLADKASDAARRVGALISAVQNDIKEVDNAIKKTTEEVDKGVKLSVSAGKSLEQITKASQELSLLISTISTEAKKNANLAKEVNNEMKKLIVITEENKDSSKRTEVEIQEISNLSKELKESVHSFKIDDK